MRVTLVPVSVTIAGSLWTGVRIHIISGNDVDTHIRRGTTHVVPLTPRNRNRRLAAAIVEKVDVRVAEVTIRDAIDDVVEAGLAQTDPGGVVEHAIGHIGRSVVGEHDSEGQPEGDEDDETVKVGARQRQIPGVVQAGLEVGRSHETFHVENDADVTVECEH